MLTFDVAILGAGVIGLACAERLAVRGLSVVVVERHARPGQETSSRNSGVLHAGIYYQPGSLKAELCSRGRRLLEERSKTGAFELRKTGKLVVATAEQEVPRLATLAENARACGVDLDTLDPAAIQRLEPALVGVAGLYSHESGILDAPGLLRALALSAQEKGAIFAFRTTVVALERNGSAWTIRTQDPVGSQTKLRCRSVVNAAGLEADRVAELAGLDVAGLGLRQIPCKGSYFFVRGLAGGLRHLVYPLPQSGGLGIHLTLELDGGVLAGPDVEFGASLDYSVDEAKREAFAQAIQRYLPSVGPSDLTPAHAGIRPKLTGPGEPFRDFVIRQEAAHGLPGLVNLLGIESPGLTACLAIAERVEHLVDEAD